MGWDEVCKQTLTSESQRLTGLGPRRRSSACSGGVKEQFLLKVELLKRFC